MRPLRILLALLLSLLPAATCGRPYRLPASAQRTLSPTIGLPTTVRKLEVQFHDGLLTIEHGPQLDCDLEIHLLAIDEAGIETLAAAVAPRLSLSDSERAATLQVALPNGADLDSVRTTWRLVTPAGIAVRVVTRRGAVVARGVRGDLVVQGGSGVLEAEMAGGTAQLSTSSGSLMLRGDYPFAEVHSQLGRVDVQLPAGRQRPVELHADSGRGDVYLDVSPEQVFDLFYLGDEHHVHCDPEVRVQWLQNVQLDGVDYVQGRLGDLHGTSSGMVRLDAQGPVYVRLRPMGTVPAGGR